MADKGEAINPVELPFDPENERIRKLLEEMVRMYSARQVELATIYQILSPVLERMYRLSALQRQIDVNECQLRTLVSAIVPPDQVDSYVNEHYRKPLNLPASHEAMFNATTPEGQFAELVCNRLLQENIFDPERWWKRE